LLENRRTAFLKFQALILLFPESNEMEREVDKVKVKLFRNPSQANSSIFGKTYTPWTGHTVEGYCNFRSRLNQYVQQAPLNNLKKRVGAITLPSSGMPLANWQNLLCGLH
jgi:hypothetical protein